MLRITGFFIVFLVSILVANSLAEYRAFAETVRNPVFAGSFYPASTDELTQTIRHFTEQAAKNSVGLPKNAKLRALTFPHAGYIYSGITAAHAALALNGRSFSKVILMGPDHRVGFRDAVISDADAFATPLGVVHLDPGAGELRKNFDVFKSVPESDRQEHSLEVVLPFLQFYLKDFTLIPIVMGPGNIDTYAKALESIGFSDTLIVASSDLSHYLSYDEAKRKDKETLHMILTLQDKPFSKLENAACGTIPIRVLMNLAQKHQWRPMLIHYSNSGDTAGPKNKVAGYAAIAFYQEAFMTKKTDQTFDEEKGRILVKLARQTIGMQLKQEITETEDVESALDDPDFKVNRGTFVTLHKNGQLRGCIGSLTASEPLAESVRHNAVNAAFRDPRFSPLSADELAQVDIEVSILTEPVPLEYKDGEDLIAKLRVKVDGVILRKGYSSATFLPQVWDQLPNPRDFLSHLCRKAGLAPDAWQTTKLEVSTYQVEYFEEK